MLQSKNPFIQRDALKVDTIWKKKQNFPLSFTDCFLHSLRYQEEKYFDVIWIRQCIYIIRSLFCTTKSAMSFREMVFFSVSGDNEAQDYWQCLYLYLSSLECVHMNIKWDLYLSEYLSATSRKQKWPSSSQWLHSPALGEMVFAIRVLVIYSLH